MINRQQYIQASNMSAFTFYLDDMTKLKVLKKLKAAELTQEKGTLSATIRVLLNLFADGSFDSIIVNDMIEQEILLTTKKNKRSSL